MVAADVTCREALRAEAIIKRCDATRIVYHHAGGNIGAMHTVNFYADLTPIQEMSDWFEHWATVGVKPLHLNEYGVPYPWDWAMYHGWYKGKREFGSAAGALGVLPGGVGRAVLRRFRLPDRRA